MRWVWPGRTAIPVLKMRKPKFKELPRIAVGSGQSRDLNRGHLLLDLFSTSAVPEAEKENPALRARLPFHPGAGLLERCPSPTRVPGSLGHLGSFQAQSQGSWVGLAARLAEMLSQCQIRSFGIQVVSPTLVPLPGPKRKRLKHVCLV